MRGTAAATKLAFKAWTWSDIRIEAAEAAVETERDTETEPEIKAYVDSNPAPGKL